MIIKQMRIKNRQGVLIVDDEPSVRRSIGRVVNRYFPECSVEQASNGLEANDRLLSINPPQLMILDLRLPYLGGLDLCRLMQRQPWRYHTRILVITGHSTPEIRQKVFQRGAAEFLEKPFEVEELARSLRRSL